MALFLDIDISSNQDSHATKWMSKKIAWYGTSIAAGYPKSAEKEIWSHANRSVRDVGAKILNYAVPNGVIRESKLDGSSMGVRDSLSFSRLSSEINYYNSMISLIHTESEPDLFIFEYGPNDVDADDTDFSGYIPGNPENTGFHNEGISISSRNKKTFIGAFNWVIDQLLDIKPDAKIAIITHYSLDSFDKKMKWEKLIAIQTALGEYRGVPFCKLHTETGWNDCNSVKHFNPDGIHPASSNSTKSVEILSNIIYHFLRTI